MKSIRILHLEDDERDSELIAQTLKSKGIPVSILRVDTESQFLEAIPAFVPDIILSDYFLSGFLGSVALSHVIRIAPAIPFLFVSGKMGEELAVECLKQGAMDYVMKNSLARLPNAIKRALDEARTRAEKKRAVEDLRQSQAQLSTLLESSPDAIWSMDASLRIKAFNPAAVECIRIAGGGQPRSGDRLSQIFPADVLQQWEAWMERVLRGESFRMEQSFSSRGAEVHHEVSLNPIRYGGAIAGAVILSRDITQRKASEREILRQRDELEKANAALRERLGIPGIGAVGAPA